MGQCNSNKSAKCLKCGFVAPQGASQMFKRTLSGHQCNLGKPILKDLVSPKYSLNKTIPMKLSPTNVPHMNMKSKKKSKAFNFLVQLDDTTSGKVNQDELKMQKFQQKLSKLRSKIQKFKKQWEHGFQVIQVDRQNLIDSSIKALQNVNLLKELRIKFKGQCAEDAGGGLLREWMHLCVKEIMSEELGLFKLANTDVASYNLVWSNCVSDQTSYKSLTLLGMIISKAILQRIQINCPLNHTILRQICCQPIHISDIHNYDKQLYRSWKNILRMSNVEQLCLQSSIDHKFSQTQSQRIQLFSDRRSIPITDQNKQQYISQLINLYCSKSIRTELDQLFSAIDSVIPIEYFNGFEPEQLQILITGPCVIDIEDWKRNTVYDCYERDDEVIRWFWELVEEYGQEGYRNLLHYATGSTRIPVMGFSKLQSNYGHIKRFTIRKVAYDETNPYPKSYTCFNRLDLPQYKTKQQLKMYLSFVLEEEFTYLGLY